MSALNRDHPSIQIATIAARQHGHITRAQLLAVGISHARIQRWCSAGRLIRVHAGVYALGYRHPEPAAVAMAAVLACGPGAVLSHESAAALYGWRWPRVPEVTAIRQRRHTGIRSHRTRSLPRGDADAPARSAGDQPGANDPGDRVAVDAHAVHANGQGRIAATPARSGGYRLLGYPAEPTRSEFEEAFRRFCRRFGLPHALTLANVHGYEVDALFVAQRVVVELDGWEFHADRAAFVSDRDRDADLLDFGYETVRITWDRLHDTPEREATRLERILARRERQLGRVS